ncbi:hypothetical protein LOTGIDRAFT_172442 [Lottia gigantea]|uniref:Uncharacterized protein n=1 Tax=Lottia gigantea TaxID=225164 RepID=V4CHS3_LOTGI|nr:hypothetical protein LOTGIDRAFT_172442 [Lottia gigantea]ESP01690.1 hypothetical protein LOTGIDRAFT_172442 [Lottia gigantea]
MYSNVHSAEKLRIEQSHFTTPSNKKIEISTIASNYHIEVNPSDVGNNDRIVIQELIKNLAQVNQLDSSSQKEFKVVVLTEVDRLTKDAQHGLRRTMEKYMATCQYNSYIIVGGVRFKAQCQKGIVLVDYPIKKSSSSLLLLLF